MQRVPGGLLFLIVATALASCPVAAVAQTERIHTYHSDITVEEDGTLRVVETIRVTAARQKINRGIYRDFPTLYKGKYFTRVKVPFAVISVRRDGKQEPYHLEDRRNGVRVYVGRKDFILRPGDYDYELTYTTKNQLGFFEKHDELYWNVTGTGWDFPIDEVTATIHLPPGVPLADVTHEGYTGAHGSKARDLSSQLNAETDTVEFATTKPLGPREGLTIVVGFPKGYVREPTEEELRQLHFQANRTLWVALGGLLVVGGYYLAAWWSVGRDPPGKPIYPQFEPPLNLPPACVRYLREMGYDKKCFTAAVLSMAVKGYAKIEEASDGTFTLRRTKNTASPSLSGGERAIAKALLKSDYVRLKQTNHKKISKAIEKLSSWLKLEYDGKLFFKNRWWLVPGWLLSAAALVAAVLSCGWTALPIVGFLSLWLSIWTIGCLALGAAALAKWKSVLSLRRATNKRLGSLLGASGITLLAAPFFAAEFVAIGFLVYSSSVWMLPLILGIVALNVAFWHLIKQPTVEGQRVMDDIEGFRMYLATAEQNLLEELHPPEKTPELFEKYLPYAMALDVENEWAEQFADILAQASQRPGDDDHFHDYSPAWYSGSNWDGATSSAFAAGLGAALGGAIASSSTAPGSSSGGGGGGFSGGGGGGGGGGGW